MKKLMLLLCLFLSGSLSTPAIATVVDFDRYIAHGNYETVEADWQKYYSSADRLNKAVDNDEYSPLGVGLAALTLLRFNPQRYGEVFEQDMKEVDVSERIENVKKIIAFLISIGATRIALPFYYYLALPQEQFDVYFPNSGINVSTVRDFVQEEQRFDEFPIRSEKEFKQFETMFNQAKTEFGL